MVSGDGGIGDLLGLALSAFSLVTLVHGARQSLDCLLVIVGPVGN
jgi:hypothetical protein